MVVDTRSLTGLRFFAAAAIVIHHSDKGVFFEGDKFAPISLGLGVPLFFALSGFVLAIHARKYESDLPSYFIARVARIWPAHIATILLLVYLFWPYSTILFQEPHLNSSILNIFLLQAWFPDKQIFFSLNAPSWSVSSEMFFYAMFPLLVWWMKSRSITKALSAYALTLTATGLTTAFFTIENQSIAWWLSYISPVTNLPTFMLGMAAGLSFSRQPSSSHPRSTEIQIAALIVLALAIWIAGYIGHGSASVVGRYFKMSGPAPFFALFLLVLARYHYGAISRFLSTGAFIYLGEISYSIYLTHQVIFRWWVDNRSLFSDYPIYLQFIMALALVLIVSALIYHLVEAPFRRWIVTGWRRLARR